MALKKNRIVIASAHWHYAVLLAWMRSKAFVISSGPNPREDNTRMQLANPWKARSCCDGDIALLMKILPRLAFVTNLSSETRWLDGCTSRTLFPSWIEICLSLSRYISKYPKQRQAESNGCDKGWLYSKQLLDFWVTHWHKIDHRWI